MKVFCKGNLVVATHDDGQAIPTGSYPGCELVVVADDYEFERYGDAPDDGIFDDRPLARPNLDLAQLKAMLKRQIDDAAETERLKYITGGAGQAMTYARKVEEARALANDNDPDVADYPLLSASVGIDGQDIGDVAQVVIGMDAAWAQIGAAIEAARLGAKAAVDTAEDETTARAVTPVWPEP